MASRQGVTNFLLRQDYYPETLKRCFIINGNWVFKLMYKIVAPFLVSTRHHHPPPAPPLPTWLIDHGRRCWWVCGVSGRHHPSDREDEAQDRGRWRVSAAGGPPIGCCGPMAGWLTCCCCCSYSRGVVCRLEELLDFFDFEALPPPIQEMMNENQKTQHKP